MFRINLLQYACDPTRSVRAGPGFSPQYTRDLIFALDLSE